MTNVEEWMIIALWWVSKIAGDPPCLLDLNPIKRRRVLLKRHVAEDYPDLADISGGVGAVNARLARVLALCWEKTPEAQFEGLWKLMPDRIQAVIGAMEWHTRYQVTLRPVVEGGMGGGCSVSSGD